MSYGSHEYESRHGPIDRTLLKVEDNGSEGVHNFLGYHGTARGWEAPLAMGPDKGEVGAAEIWDNAVGRGRIV